MAFTMTLFNICSSIDSISLYRSINNGHHWKFYRCYCHTIGVINRWESGYIKPRPQIVRDFISTVYDLL